MRKVDFTFISRLREDLEGHAKTCVVFIRPEGSKLFRVHECPDSEEVRQVLTTLCTIYRNGVWYFRLPTEMDQLEVKAAFLLMDVDHLFVEPDTQFVEPNYN